MTNKFQVNGENLFEKKKMSSVDKIQESQTDRKQLRTLQLLFQMNLNKFIRKNKDAFGGAIEVPLNRTLMTKDQYETSKKALESLDDCIQRLVKGMLARNNYLEKQFKSYQDAYRQSSVTPALESQQSKSKVQDERKDPVHIVCQNSWEGYQSGSKSNLQKNIFSQARPYSATLASRSFSLKRPRQRISFTRPMSSQLSKQQKQRNTINLKNINLHKVKIEKDSRKVPLYRQSLRQVQDFERYQQEQVYIRKKIVSDSIGFNEIKLKNGHSYFSNNPQKPERLQRFKNVRNQSQYLNELEKQRLQNKIMMVNSVLAFNLSQTQGYKAKSKYWTNIIIS